NRASFTASKNLLRVSIFAARPAGNLLAGNCRGAHSNLPFICSRRRHRGASRSGYRTLSAIILAPVAQHDEGQHATRPSEPTQRVGTPAPARAPVRKRGNGN